MFHSSTACPVERMCAGLTKESRPLLSEAEGRIIVVGTAQAEAEGGTRTIGERLGRSPKNKAELIVSANRAVVRVKARPRTKHSDERPLGFFSMLHGDRLSARARASRNSSVSRSPGISEM